MNINIRLNKNFTTQYNKLQEEYGTELAKINGFDDDQLSYTDFIDEFIDKETVADSSIDGNSNVSHKNIVTLLSEMPKPHRKVLAFNKIYFALVDSTKFKTKYLSSSFNKGVPFLFLWDIFGNKILHI